MRLFAWVLGVVAITASVTNPVAARQPSDVLTVKAVSQMKKVHRGDQFAVAVIFNVNSGWHVWPARGTAKIPAGQEAWWTAIGPADAIGDNEKAPPTLFQGNGFKAYVAGIQWPKPVNAKAAGGTIQIPAYVGRGVAFIPIVVADDAPLGTVTLDWALGYQPCDDHICEQPDAKPFSASWEVVATDQVAVAGDDASLFAKFDPSVIASFASQVNSPTSDTPAGAARQSFDFFGYSFTLASNQYTLIFLIAFLAGILLNLTPCVLPVIPIKVLSLQKQAGNPAKLALYGTVYCIGIVVTFAAFGLLIAFARQQWGQLFSMPWFAATMGAIVLVLGIGMMGVFTIQLPQAVYMINPAGDTVQGNFLMGIFTAILSTPCTGPFFGAALAWAATQPTWVGLTTLIVVGAGMAFPYALLIAFPKLIDKMPRSGPGGELLKQVLGILMIAVAAFLFSNLVHAEWKWWVVTGIAAAGFAWALVGGMRILKTPQAKVIVTLISLVGLSSSVGLGYVMTRPSGIPWKIYATPEGGIQKAIDEGKAAGKFVVVKFTANWCTNCIAIERTVYNSTTGRREMNRPDVVAIKVDLTNQNNKEGWDLLKQFSGGSGIPFSVFYRPMGDPVSFRSFFKISDLQKALSIKTASLAPPLSPHPAH